jgi:hypothetical protein
MSRQDTLREALATALRTMEVRALMLFALMLLLLTQTLSG